ncbi:MAG: TIGR02757 family protein [Epsilonproteobacteria bacterium]|nr:TIGR02757 family protein [Campylobacterota bacterium]
MNLNDFLSDDIYDITPQKPDPLLIAKKHNTQHAALAAALFAYGNVKAIIKFLNSLDLENFRSNGAYYRFQTSKDVEEFLKTLKLLKDFSLNEIFLKGYKHSKNPVDGIREIIKTIYSLNPYRSKGYEFLIGKIPPSKTKGVSPYKRWNMFIRWMVRKNAPDMGMWEGVKSSDLIIPLDTHTHAVSLKLGLIKRKSYDLQTAIELTNKLKEYDPLDPLKYDFVLYRIGQLKIV